MTHTTSVAFPSVNERALRTVITPPDAWHRLRDMQTVVAQQSTIAHAVRCLPLFDLLELQLEVQKHAKRLAEEYGVTNIAELVDLPDKAPASVGAVVTNLRLRLTRKGKKMAWLTLADATGAIEAAVFPQAFMRLADAADGEAPLREGAFLVARGRLSQEEATGSKSLSGQVRHAIGH